MKLACQPVEVGQLLGNRETGRRCIGKALANAIELDADLGNRWLQRAVRPASMFLMSAKSGHCFIDPLLAAMADALDPPLDVDLAHKA